MALIKSQKLANKLIFTVLAMSGIVIGHMTLYRLIVMALSLAFSLIILPRHTSLNFSLLYFILSTLFYLSLIFGVLSTSGLKKPLIKRYGEEKAFRYFESFLAFAFFHNAVGLTNISKNTATSFVWDYFSDIVIYIIVSILFFVGLTIKIWSAIVLDISLYYWKDMFLGRNVSTFIMKGPYKYLSNPMYGLGQTQVYATAIYYGSVIGIVCAVINQLSLFVFYYSVEKPFIKETYLNKPKGDNLGSAAETTL